MANQVGNLLGGFLQGYAQSRQQKLDGEAKQEFIKLQTKQYQRQLEEKEQQKNALNQLMQVLNPQPVGPPTAQGQQAATPKPRSAMDMLVDPELQALALQAGQVKVEDLMKYQGQKAQLDQAQQFMSGMAQPGQGGYGPPTITMDAQGRPSLSFSPSKPPTMEQQIGAQSLVDAGQSARSVGTWLTDGKAEIGGQGFDENISIPKLAALATRTGEGAQMYDDLIRSVMNIVYAKSGKQITESEAARTIGPLIPQVGDVTAMFNLFGEGDMVSVDNLKRNAGSKLRSLKSLIDGTMGADEIQKLLKAQGIKVDGMAKPPKLGDAQTRPLPPRQEVTRYRFDPATGELVPQ